MSDDENSNKNKPIEFIERLYEDNELLLLTQHEGKIYEFIEGEISGYFSAIDLENSLNSIFQNNMTKIPRKISIERISSILHSSVKNEQIKINIINILEYFQMMISDISFLDFEKNIDFQEETKLNRFFEEMENYENKQTKEKDQNKQNENNDKSTFLNYSRFKNNYNKELYKDISMRVEDKLFYLNFFQLNIINTLRKKITDINIKAQSNNNNSYQKTNNNNFNNLNYEDNQMQIKDFDKNKINNNKNEKVHKKIIELAEEIKEKSHLKKDYILERKNIKHKNLFQNYYLLINNRIFFHKFLKKKINRATVKDIEIPDVDRINLIDVSFFINMLFIFCKTPETRKIEILFDILKNKISLIENDDMEYADVKIKINQEVVLHNIKVKYFHEIDPAYRTQIYKTLKYNYQDEEFRNINFNDFGILFNRYLNEKNNNYEKSYENKITYLKNLYIKNKHFFFYFKKPKKIADLEFEDIIKEKNKTKYDYYTLNLEHYFKQYLIRKRIDNKLSITDDKYIHTFMRNHILIHLYLSEFIFTDLIYKKIKVNKVQYSTRKTNLITGSQYSNNIVFLDDNTNIINQDYPVFDIEFKETRDIYDNLTKDCIIYKKLLFFASETKGILNDFSNYIYYNSIFKKIDKNGLLDKKDFLQNYKILNSTQSKEHKKNFSKLFNCNLSPDFNLQVKNLNIFSSTSIRKNFINYYKGNKKTLLFLEHIPKFYNYYHNLKRGLSKKRNLIDKDSIIKLNAIDDYIHYKKIFSQKKIYSKNFEKKKIEELKKILDNKVMHVEFKINKDIQQIVQEKSIFVKNVFKNVYRELLLNIQGDDIDQKRYLDYNYKTDTDDNPDDNPDANKNQVHMELNNKVKGSKINETPGEINIKNKKENVEKLENRDTQKNSYFIHSKLTEEFLNEKNEISMGEDNYKNNSIGSENKDLKGIFCPMTFNKKNMDCDFNQNNLDIDDTLLKQEFYNLKERERETKYNDINLNIDFDKIILENKTTSDINKRDLNNISITQDNKTIKNLKSELNSILMKSANTSQENPNESLKELNMMNKIQYPNTNNEKNNKNDKSDNTIDYNGNSKILSAAKRILNKNITKKTPDLDKKIIHDNKKINENDEKVKKMFDVNDFLLNKKDLTNTESNLNINAINQKITEEKRTKIKTKSKKEINTIDNNKKIKICEFDTKNSNNDDEYNKFFRIDTDPKFEVKSNLNNNNMILDKASELNSERYRLNPVIKKISTETDYIKVLNIDELSVIPNEYEENDIYINEENSMFLIETQGNRNVKKQLNISNISNSFAQKNLNININNMNNYKKEFDDEENLIIDNSEVVEKKITYGNEISFESINNEKKLHSHFNNIEISKISIVKNESLKTIDYVNADKLKQKYEISLDKFLGLLKNKNHENDFLTLKTNLESLNPDIVLKNLKISPKDISKDTKIKEIAKMISEFKFESLNTLYYNNNFDENLLNIYFKILEYYNLNMLKEKKIKNRTIILDTKFFRALQECLNNDDFDQVYEKYHKILFDNANKFILESESMFKYLFYIFKRNLVDTI